MTAEHYTTADLAGIKALQRLAYACAMTVAAARHRLAALISFNVFITALQAGLKTRPLRSGTRTKGA